MRERERERVRERENKYKTIRKETKTMMLESGHISLYQTELNLKSNKKNVYFTLVFVTTQSVLFI